MLVKNPNLHIRRFEFKYLVRENSLDKLRRSLGNFVLPDPYAAGKVRGVYPVTSLYFDNQNFFTYYEKLAGLKSRKKFRIRTYESRVPKNAVVFLEIKRRDEVVIFKDRSMVPLGDIREALEGGRYDQLLNHGEKEVTNQFVSHYLTKSLTPRLLVSYVREAYLDTRNHSFRITLDHDLRAEPKYEIDFAASDKKNILPGYVILEAKFNRIMPAWFGQIIKTFELNKVSFSKYCFGLESCGIVPKSDLSTAY